jgi:hypothetical protein
MGRRGCGVNNNKNPFLILKYIIKIFRPHFLFLIYLFSKNIFLSIFLRLLKIVENIANLFITLYFFIFLFFRT